MTLEPEVAGRLFRTAWLEGVDRHPGGPSPGIDASWDEMPEWERDGASTVAEQIAQFVVVSKGRTSRLTRAQRGQFVATCWIAQVHRHVVEPRLSCITPWEELPEWQRQTAAHVFDVIEQAVNERRAAGS